VKIDGLDHCIKTEAGRGLAFRMQTHFAIHPTDPYKSPVVSPRTGNAGSTLIGLFSFPQTAKPYLT
jgi:hypothetical protein